MTDRSPKDQLNQWATEECPARKRCLTCQDPHFHDLAVEFVKLAQARETNRSLMAFHRWLKDTQGYPYSYSAIRTHILYCIGADDVEE